MGGGDGMLVKRDVNVITLPGTSESDLAAMQAALATMQADLAIIKTTGNPVTALPGTAQADIAAMKAKIDTVQADTALAKADLATLLAFERGVQRQPLVKINHSVFEITIVAPDASQTDTLTINAVPYEYVPSATPTKQEISDAIIALIEAGAQAGQVRVSQGEAPGYDVILDTYHPSSSSANLAQTTSVGDNLVNDGDPCYLVALLPQDINTGAVTIKGGATTELTLAAGVLSPGMPVPYFGARFGELRISLAEAADVLVALYISEE